MHFTQEILKKLSQKGVKIGYVTLNVGIGTFRPVKCENILEHKMDSESFEITHTVTSRAVFANGALKAAKFLIEQKNGLYNMKDLIN